MKHAQCKYYIDLWVKVISIVHHICKMFCHMCHICMWLTFISICKEYDIFRRSLYNKINEKSDIFRNVDNNEKFIFIKKTGWKLLSKYLVNAWNKRNSKIYTTK